ncbi:Acetyltransferase (GNAT) family protein [Fontibacillus panacisegetis]|uniref:Acetyltransferase (GNAT) family protein n=1 Tax=Fontibacillus panacisegetis TaxID=670482 RepID=A0A1G7GZ00_9BACL|nr:GNAT family N-acetyltransferase [Fontibacillus panacisegetis]SDE93294.1 Acetyltransferase (GNAT) family protein [Fontibacillus panacisegetis]
MITLKPLNELPVEAVSELWNQAFEGYFANVSMPLDRFIARTVNEGLSLEHSFACYADHEVAGIVLNGFRDSNGQKIAWNGGTAVMPSFRGKGIGKVMMAKNIEYYTEQGLDIAYLEAISKNQHAIHVYEKVGYKIIDRLLLLSCDQLNRGNYPSTNQYQVVKGLAVDAVALPFYQPGEVWQAQWQSLKDGESLIVYDKGEPAGFAQFRRTFNSSGKLLGITLYRCEVSPGRIDGKAIMLTALQELWGSEPDCKRSAMNIRAKEKALIHLLEQLSFKVSMEQVLMRRISINI